MEEVGYLLFCKDTTNPYHPWDDGIFPLMIG